MAVKQIKKK